MALNAVLTFKVDRSFAQMDVDGNGYIERDDLRALATRLLDGFAEEPGSAKGRDLLGAFDGIWDALVEAMDADGDGRLSPEEFRQGVDQTFVSGPEYDAVFQPAAEAMMRLCDTDGDGVLSREEFGRFQAAFGTSPGDVQAAFEAMDRDGSGTLDTAELLVAIREFYTSPDPTAPGNLLHGPL